MTLAELRQEIQDSGLDHLTDTRINRLVNLAYKKTYNRELWPWRLTETTGAAPVTITGAIRQVISPLGYPLPQMTQESLENNGELLTTTGTAEVWYFNEDRAVGVYPVDTGTLTVRYYGKATTLSADSDTPDIPEDYHYLLALDAIRRGKLENGEVEAAQAYAADYEELLKDLKRDAFNEAVAGPERLNNLSEGV